jgi:hydrogenase expression/formation protein HypC
MCIAFPGKILSINENRSAVIDIGGVQQEVSLDIMDEEVGPGVYVLCHAGFAIHRVDEAQAIETIDLLKKIIEDEIY